MTLASCAKAVPESLRNIRSHWILASIMHPGSNQIPISQFRKDTRSAVVIWITHRKKYDAILTQRQSISQAVSIVVTDAFWGGTQRQTVLRNGEQLRTNDMYLKILLAFDICARLEWLPNCAKMLSAKLVHSRYRNSTKLPNLIGTKNDWSDVIPKKTIYQFGLGLCIDCSANWIFALAVHKAARNGEIWGRAE